MCITQYIVAGIVYACLSLGVQAQLVPATGTASLAGVVMAADADYTNTAALAASAVQGGDTATLNARTSFTIADIMAVGPDAEPESIRGAVFVDQGSALHNGQPVWWSLDNTWALWYNSTSNKWWISGATNSPSAGWESDTMTGEFTALSAAGTVTMTGTDLRLSELNGYQIATDMQLSKFQVPPNPNEPSNALAGSLRYRVQGTNAYLEAVMQTGTNTWAWTEVIKTEW